MKIKTLITAVASFFILHSALAFEGRITAALTRGGQATPLLYTAGTNCLRLEVTVPDQPNPVDLLDLPSGKMTLLFPHNRSFVRLKAASENTSSVPPGFPAMPQMPPGVGPQPQTPPSPAGIGQPNLPGMPTPPAKPQMPTMPNMRGGGGMPAMPTMPMMEKMELTATGDKTNLLGFACEKYKIKQRGEVMEIWATDKLFPFQPYQQNQPHRFGPRGISEQWGDLLKAKKLFPLLAVLRFERPPAPGGGAPPVAGPERCRFEVKSITPEAITDNSLFQPPSEYQEIQPMPF
jgi:hypothetical protein